MRKKYEFCIRLSPSEQEQLVRNATLAGLSKTAYLRRLIMGHEIKGRPSGEIKALRTEVHKIGNNINQIARGVNTNTATAEDIAQSRYLMEQVYRLMYEIGKP
ncbi:plasmid mobilization relaxosome protein MobC [Bengtsoniella intestinalis]|uniref:plasmid mobilization protein n=1 Tax=Bengtsoniella intestinalis TaxID=3073143 RepID=UPI00391F306C